jgi:tetratricopeptide (TPR) repeat protein
MRRLLLLLAFALPLSAADLGSVAFPTSAKTPKAQALFERGLAALHSFWYDEAANSFRSARELEPSFAMAYWGEALAHNHPIWMEQDRDAALAVLKALPTDAGQRAVALEEAAAAPSGPPDVLKPSHELLGELLAAAGRCDEAKDAFRKSLLRTRNRRLSMNPPPCADRGQ